MVKRGQGPEEELLFPLDVFTAWIGAHSPRRRGEDILIYACVCLFVWDGKSHLPLSPSSPFSSWGGMKRGESNTAGELGDVPCFCPF